MHCIERLVFAGKTVLARYFCRIWAVGGASGPIAKGREWACNGIISMAARARILPGCIAFPCASVAKGHAFTPQILAALRRRSG